MPPPSPPPTPPVPPFPPPSPPAPPESPDPPAAPPTPPFPPPSPPPFSPPGGPPPPPRPPDKDWTCDAVEDLENLQARANGFEEWCGIYSGKENTAMCENAFVMPVVEKICP